MVQLLVLVLAVARCAAGTEGQALDWPIDDPREVGGRDTTVLGEPTTIATSWGAALEFDGRDDALVLDLHPLEGATAFTVEAWFRPDADGGEEQRFVHLQEEASEDRVLLETRLVPGGKWFLDTFVKTRDRAHTLFAKSHLHRVGEWYHAALVVGGGSMRHYVNGVLELEREIDWAPPGEGQTSLGMRLNRVSYFKGALARVRFTPRALDPAEFLPPPPKDG